MVYAMNSLTDDKDDKQDMRILNELENIDDELEKEGIVIVRIDNAAEAKEYGLDHLPALIYFENKIPALYEGDLMNEDEVLEWLLVQKKTATIEEVTDEILVNLINEHEYVVVFFTGPCEPGETCDHTLNALESIDDELDEAGIIFVTTEDTGVAKKYNVKTYPYRVGMWIAAISVCEKKHINISVVSATLSIGIFIKRRRHAKNKKVFPMH